MLVFVIYCDSIGYMLRNILFQPNLKSNLQNLKTFSYLRCYSGLQWLNCFKSCEELLTDDDDQGADVS